MRSTTQNTKSESDSRRRSRRAALIGVGGYGSNHLQVLRELEGQGKVRLVAVADPFEDKMPDVAAQLRESGVVWYRDYREMLAREEALDLAVIATPIHLHEQMALDVLGSDTSRILLEKPAVPTLQQLERLIAADPASRVRVGFQTVHLPQVRRLKEWVARGELGKIRTVSVVAGWPRDDAYFARSAWAGRMSHNGQIVFDGPATNALSHVVNNVCYVLGDGPASFGRAESVSGWLARARSMESYDTFFSECRIGGVHVRALLSHAVAELVPYAVKVEGDTGTAVFSQEQPFLQRSDRTHAEVFGEADLPQTAMYKALLGSEDDFAAMPGKLADVRGYTEWTEGVRLAGPIREFGPAQCRNTDDGVVAVRGMEEALRSFLDGGSAPEPGLV